MPKKTKRQKILAEARRIIRENKSAAGNPQRTVSQPSESVASNQSVTYKMETQISKELQKTHAITPLENFRSIQIGIIKTILFAAVAIVIELILYWQLK